MSSIVLEKMNRLPAEVKAKLAEPDILARLDALGTQYGVKETLIILDLLLGELTASTLPEKLKTEYSFNDYLAQEISGKLLALAKELHSPKNIEPVNTQKNVSPSANIKTKNLEPEPSISETAKSEIKKNQETKISDDAKYVMQAEKIIADSGFTGDEIINGRLKNIIIAKLRGVRDDLETLDSLMKNKKVGGLEFTPEQADTFLMSINSPVVATAKSITPVKKNESKLPANFTLDFGDEDDDDEVEVASEKTSTNSVFRIEEEGGLPVVRTPDDLLVIPNKPAVLQAKELPPTVKNDKINTVASQAQKKIPVAVPRATPIPYDVDKKLTPPPITRVGNRPTLDGIKVERRLFGPIEELENLTMIDFRRISADSTIAVNKIKEKIDLLGEESFGKRIAGIEAWHKSEVNKFYRLLGQASMADGFPVEQIIRDRLFSGKPTLSIDEFNAIMELNRALRY